MANGQVLYGSKFDEADNFGYPFTEQMQDVPTAKASIAGSGLIDATPHDEAATLIRTVQVPTAQLEAYIMVTPAMADVQVPNVLNSLTAVFNTDSGSGTYSESASGESVGAYARLGLSVRGSGQGSAAVIPELIPDFTQYWGVNRPVVQYMFYALSPVAIDDVLTRLTVEAGDTVSMWPQFQPRSNTLILKGAQTQVSAQAMAHSESSISASNVTYTISEGGGESYTLSLTTKEMELPLCLHGVIVISPTSATATATATADALITAGTNFFGQEGTGSASKTVTGSISASGLTATSPEGPPTSGLYLHRVRAEPYKFGFVRVICEVLDFADL